MIVAWAACWPWLAGVGAAQRVDYNRDVRPILSNHCFKCHGPDVREAGLRLDVAAGATAALPSGETAIVANHPQQSAVVARIEATDPELRMPPAGEAPALSPAHIATLRQWIAQGAPYARHWAFVPPRRGAPPAVNDAAWCRNEIDRFVLARLEAEGLAPAPAADRATLIRRVSLDLTGLPPTPDEVRAFVADPAHDAYERLVDRLLASGQYGVRQAMPWLDLARYADSDGYPHDRYRTVWPYRDWVVDALNRDMPYDRFSIEQLAGDLLPRASESQRVASAFNRLTRINREAGVDPEEFRLEAVIDRVNTTATVWLGATLGCAQCHDHKYDPYTQREYYRLLAYFNNDAVETTVDAAGVISDVSPRMEWSSPEMTAARQPAVQLLVMRAHDAPRVTRVFLRGSFLTPGDPVEPGTPAAFDTLPAPAGRDRLALARWLVDDRHPLAARVAVNRLWAQYFGTGLVETLDDFGSQAPPCTHPELLDWLALTLVDRGWHQKPLHRLIVTSATYRQATGGGSARHHDPHNRLLARAPRLRLPAEVVRDNALAAAGILGRELGGPSLVARAGAPDQANPRRSIYLRWTRQTLDDMLANFDAPTRDVTCTRRTPTNTPLQALTLLNDATFLDAARGLALRAASAGGEDFDARLDYAFLATLARAPSDSERRVLGDLFERRRQAFAADADAAARLLGAPEAAGAQAESAAWVLVANTLLNLNEFITRE